MHWSDVRPGWPQREVHLFGPGIDSGTYDYFTKVIVGEEPASPADFTSSEDDNVLVAGVASDPHALAFFGFAYQNENRSKLRLVPIDDGRPGNGAGPIAPTAETVGNGTYQPLSRPIFIYAALSGQTRPEVDRFVEFFLREGPALAKELGYTPLSPLAAEAVLKRWQARSTGSLYRGAEDRSGTRVEDLLVREATQDAAAATL